MRADDLWMHLEGVGIERSASGSRGGHPDFGRAEDKLKHMLSKRCAAAVLDAVAVVLIHVDMIKLCQLLTLTDIPAHRSNLTTKVLKQRLARWSPVQDLF